MSPRLRKMAVTAHVVGSVGWVGAVASFIALCAVGLRSANHATTASMFLATGVLGRSVIVPCALTALATGFVLSVGTEWGLAKHYWVLVKLLLTLGATALLLVHMGPVNQLAAAAAADALGHTDLGPLQKQVLVDAVLGLVPLLVMTTLSVFKPWGITPWSAESRVTSGPRAAERTGRPRPSPTWGMYALVAIGGLVGLALIVHLIGGGLHGH